LTGGREVVAGLAVSFLTVLLSDPNTILSTAIDCYRNFLVSGQGHRYLTRSHPGQARLCDSPLYLSCRLGLLPHEHNRDRPWER
jgi:hypothetical protein